MSVAIKPVSTRSTHTKKLIANAIGFQIVWFVCVQGHSYYALLAALLLLIFHQLIFNPPLKFWKSLFAFSLLGYLGDGIIAYLFQLNYSVTYTLNYGVSNTFADSRIYSLFAPLWLMSLWFAFTTTLNYSMQWLFKSPYLTLTIAVLLVPLSYLAGIKLSGSSFSSLNNFTQAGFFLTEGLWWVLLLAGYYKLALSHSNSGTHHV